MELALEKSSVGKPPDHCPMPFLKKRRWSRLAQIYDWSRTKNNQTKHRVRQKPFDDVTSAKCQSPNLFHQTRQWLRTGGSLVLVAGLSSETLTNPEARAQLMLSSSSQTSAWTSLHRNRADCLSLHCNHADVAPLLPSRSFFVYTPTARLYVSGMIIFNSSGSRPCRSLPHEE